MNKGLCVYPGSFDPITSGHLDIIKRGAGIFEHVIVAVLHNPAKTGVFPIEQRLDMLRRACGHLPNVSFDCFDGLLVDYMRKKQAHVVLRGLRCRHRILKTNFRWRSSTGKWRRRWKHCF